MDEQTLALLAALLRGRGGSDLSSTLNDPFLAYLAGTYQPEPQKSEGDIYAEQAPTLMSIQANEPEGSWRRVAAGQIASGVPAYRVKDNILAMVEDNPDSLGLLTSSEALKFVDDLAAENQRAQNEITKQVERKDPFQKAGLPGAMQQYSPSDIVNLYPDAFASIVNRAQPQEITDRLKAIEEYGKRIVKTQKKERTPQETAAATAASNERRIRSSETARLAISNGIARQYGLTQSQVMRPDPNDIRQVRANEAYNAQIASSAQVVGGGGVDVDLGGIARKGLIASFPGGSGLVTLGKILSYNPEKARQKREAAKMPPEPPKAPEMVVNKSATEALRNTAAEAAKLVSRMKGGQEYNERVAAALAEQLSGRMAAQGRTPLSDALVRNAIINRAFRK